VIDLQRLRPPPSVPVLTTVIFTRSWPLSYFFSRRLYEVQMMASAVSGYINAILKNAFDRPLTHFGRDISQLAHVGCKVGLVADLATTNASSSLWICRRTDPTFANLVRSWLPQFISSKDRSPFSGRRCRKGASPHVVRGKGGGCGDEGVAGPERGQSCGTLVLRRPRPMVGQWAGCRPL